MSNNNLIKVYVLDNGFLIKDIAFFLKEFAQKDFAPSINLKIITQLDTCARLEEFNPIQRGHDIYYLHLARLEEEDIRALRQEQPNSYIMARSGPQYRHISQNPLIQENIINFGCDIASEKLIGELKQSLITTLKHKNLTNKLISQEYLPNKP